MTLFQKLQGIDASKVKNDGLKDQIIKAQSGFTEDGLENETIKKTVEKLIALTEKAFPQAMKGSEAPKAAEPEKPKEQPKAQEKKPVEAVKTAPTAKPKPTRVASRKSKVTAKKATPAEAKTGKSSAMSKIWAIAKAEGVSFSEASKLFKQKSGDSKEVGKAKKNGAYTREINKMKKAGTYGKATAGNNIAKDRQRDALPAGKRISQGGSNQYGKSLGGKTYYEYRANRADWNPRLRLAKGGAIDGGYEVGDAVEVQLNNGKTLIGKLEKVNPLKIRTDATSTQVLPNSLVKSIKKLAKGGAVEGDKIIKKGNRVQVVGTQFDGEEGLVVSNDLVGGKYQVQMEDSKIKGFPFENLVLLSSEQFAKGGAVEGINNSDLVREIEKHRNADEINLSKGEDNNASNDYPFYLTVNDDSYYYADKASRDADHDAVSKMDSMYAKGGAVEGKVDELWNGYATAVLFAETDMDTEELLDANFSISDFDDETVKSSKKMLAEYYSKNKKAIEESELDLDTIGSDIWYTRAGHGAGFFDHNLDADVEEKLTKGAKALGEFPSVETYDGKISIRGGRVFKYAMGGAIDESTDLTEQHLEMLVEYSEKIGKMLTDNTQLETWVVSLLSKAEQSVADVKHNIEHLNPEKFAKGGHFSDGAHVKMQMVHINTYAKEMLMAIKKGLVFEPWMSTRIAIAASNIDSVNHYLDTTIGGKKFAKGGAVEGNEVWKVVYLDKDGEYIDETEVDEKDDELAWDLFKEFGHKKAEGTYLEWQQMDDEEYAKGGAVEGKLIDTDELHEKIQKAIEAAEGSTEYEFHLMGEDGMEIALWDNLSNDYIDNTSAIRDPKLKKAVEAVFDEIKEHNEKAEPEGEAEFMGKEIERSGGGFFDFLKGILPFMD
jgi:hypothetical protein